MIFIESLVVNSTNYLMKNLIALMNGRKINSFKINIV